MLHKRTIAFCVDIARAIRPEMLGSGVQRSSQPCSTGVTVGLHYECISCMESGLRHGGRGYSDTRSTTKVSHVTICAGLLAPYILWYVGLQ